MLSWTGQLGEKRWLEVGEQAPAALQLLPASMGKCRRDLPSGESPRCCQQLSSMPCPTVLVCGTRPALSTSPPPALSIFRHKEADSWCCPISVSGFGPLVSALRAAWVRASWVLRPTCGAMGGDPCLSAHAVHWSNWNQPRDCTGHLGDFLAPCNMGKEGSSGW